MHEAWKREWWQRLEGLRDRFPELIAKAEALQSPNAKDDVYVKMAIVGFCQVADGTGWKHRHWEAIHSLRTGDYADEELAWYEKSAQRVALFACLSYGLLLGLNEVEPLTDHQRLHAATILPGFILQHLPRIGA